MDVDDEEKRRQERRNKRKQRQKEQEQEQEKPSGLEGVTMESKVGKGTRALVGCWPRVVGRRSSVGKRVTSDCTHVRSAHMVGSFVYWWFLNL